MNVIASEAKQSQTQLEDCFVGLRPPRNDREVIHGLSQKSIWR